MARRVSVTAELQCLEHTVLNSRVTVIIWRVLMITPRTGKSITTKDSILPPSSYKLQLTDKILTCRQKTLIILSFFARHNPRTIAQSTTAEAAMTSLSSSQYLQGCCRKCCITSKFFYVLAETEFYWAYQYIFRNLVEQASVIIPRVDACCRIGAAFLFSLAYTPSKVMQADLWKVIL